MKLAVVMLVLRLTDLFPASAETVYIFAPLLASQLRDTTFISQFTVADKFWGAHGSGKKQ